MNITDIRIQKPILTTACVHWFPSRWTMTLLYMISKSSRDRNACLLQCPAAKMKTVPSGISSHPITPQARKQLEDAVLQAYQQYITQQQEVGGTDSTPDSFF